MYTRMLVPLDGTRRSAAVIPHAIHAAKNLACGVMLVRVLPRTAADGRDTKVAQTTGFNELAPRVAEAERYLQSVSKRFEKTSIMTLTQIRCGDPAAEIRMAAVNFEADIIAMATRSRRGLEKLVFGSVAEEVLRGSEVPILLITAR